MYEIKNLTYSEAGYILKRNNAYGFIMSSDQTLEEVKPEVVIDPDRKRLVFGPYMWDISGIRKYADAKKYIIQKRYSNDDQIAIMLNKDDDPLSFQKMQEWREWASVVAKKIMEVLNETD